MTTQRSSENPSPKKRAPSTRKASASAREQKLAEALAAVLSDATPEQRAAFVTTLRAASAAAFSREHGDDSAASAEVVGAMESLARVAPILHEHPNAMLALESLLQRANATAVAQTMPLGAPGALATRGYADMMTWAAGGDGRPSGTSGQSISSGPTFSFLNTTGRDQAVGVPNARQLRTWADSVAWLRAAIDIRTEQIGHAEISVLPMNLRRRLDSGRKRVQRDLSMLLQQPNKMRQNWSEFMGSVLEDYLVLARGCMEKVQNAGGKPIELYPLNGAGLKIYPGWAGDPDVPRYLYEDPDVAFGESGKRPLLNDEAIVILGTPGSYRFSLSLVQVLINEIQADIAAMAAAKKTVALRPPPNLINIPETSQTDINALARRLESEFAGKRDIALISTQGEQLAQVFSLVSSAKDSQFLELQIYLARKICAVMKVSPQQVGITFDINRANGEVQQDIFKDTGKIPVFLTIEHYLNRELLADFAPRMPDGWRSDLDALNLRIVFPEISESARLAHIQEVAGLLGEGLSGLPFMTLNMALLAMGEEPVPHGFGNSFVFPTTSGLLITGSYDLELNGGDYNTLGAADPAQGGQDPAGGPSADEGDADDAPADAGDSNGKGNGGSGSGDSTGAPSSNAPASGDAPSAPSSGDGGASSAAAKSITGWYRSRETLHAQRDTRPPGQRWQPWHSGMTSSDMNSGSHDGQSGEIAPARASRRSSLPPQVGYGGPLPPSSSSSSSSAVPGVLRAATADDARGDEAPQPRGRVSAHTARRLKPSAGERDARTRLNDEASRIFREAAERGRSTAL